MYRKMSIFRVYNKKVIEFICEILSARSYGGDIWTRAEYFTI